MPIKDAIFFKSFRFFIPRLYFPWHIYLCMLTKVSTYCLFYIVIETSIYFIFILDFNFLISNFFIFTSVLSLPYGFQIVQNLPFLGAKFPSLFLLKGKEDSIAQREKGCWKFDSDSFFVHNVKSKMQRHFKYLQFKSFLMV